MPAPDFDIEEAKTLRKQLGIELDSQGPNVQQEDVDAMMRLDKAIDEYYASQRKVDASGKLLAPPETKTPSIVGSETGGDHHFHFEPSVDQVVKLVQANPWMVDQFHLQKWMIPEATPELTMQMPDAAGMGSVGSNTQPPTTFLQKMTSDSRPYKAVADWLWDEKAKEAQEKGYNLRRYKDAHLRPSKDDPNGYADPVDFLVGGAEYNIDRRLAPAALGVADANSLGTASPLYDAVRDLADYKLTQHAENKRLHPDFGEPREPIPLTDPMTGLLVMSPNKGEWENERSADILPDETGLPSSEELKDRSPLSYLAGSLVGYGTSFNPTNSIQEQVAKKILGYSPGGGFGGLLKNTLLKAPLAGATGNVIEGAVRDYANDVNRVGSREGDWQASDFGEAAGAIPAGIIPNALIGGGMSAVAEPLVHGANAFREGFEFRNPTEIKNLRLAGGETSIVGGMKAPKEVDDLVRESLQDKSTGSPGAIAADRLAPRIQKSLASQEAGVVKKTGEDLEAYFNHPVYGKLKAKGTRLVNALIEMVQQDSFHSPVTNTPGNMNPGLVNTASKELASAPWAEPQMVPSDQTSELVQRTGGVPVNWDTANKLFGDAVDEYIPGHDIVVVPHEFTAREITGMERKVDRLLKMHSESNVPADPVHERLNEALKDTRDDFPLYRDESGQLVAPPEPEAPQQPYGRAADAPPVGPAPAPAPGEGVSKYPSPIDLRGTSLDGVAPGSERGVGGPEPPLPTNPFDPRGRVQSGVLDEAIAPQPTLHVQGDYAPPETIYNPPEAIPGPGPRRDQSQLQGVARPDQVVPEAPPVDVTGGDYFEPGRVDQSEPPPIDTPRMPLGRPVGVPEHPRMLEESTPLSEMANGTEPAMSVEPEESFMSVAPEESMAPSADPMLSMQAEIARAQRGTAQAPEAEPLMSEGPVAVREAPASQDSRSPLEMMLDGGLEKADMASRVDTSTPPESFSPGREARSTEAARMGELSDVQQAYEEAETQLRKVEDRLGPYDDESRRGALLDLLKQKLGRDVTMDEVIQASSPKGPGGPVGMFLLPFLDRIQGKGNFSEVKPKKPPTQPEATLDNGKKVKGFSAFRHEQHLALNDIADRAKNTGAGSDKGIRDRIIGFNKGNDITYDTALRGEANRIGAEKELWQASLAGERVRLAQQNLLGGKGGDMSREIGFLGPRLHHATSVLSGQPRNPYASGPDGLGEELFRMLLANPSRRLLNLSGGAPGARFGNDAERIYDLINSQSFPVNMPQTEEDDKKDQP